VTPISETVARVLPQLPEPRAAQLLFERLIAEQPSLERVFQRDPGLLSDVLTLAAWSPLLATTLENNPDYVTWLQRERAITRVRTREELGESLGRFALINSQINPHVMLSRFRRRELLRTYLHDIRRTRTIVETTDELSGLADTVLERALKLCRQELDNRYGLPQTVDAHGRTSGAEFCIVALGKLGSGELNYASDIDLSFLFSGDGMTSAGGSRGQITNREYFVKLAERLLLLVDAPTGEGAAYRIDARLRPHGRQGALACSITEAVNYYEGAAADWELQALIRARSAAGSTQLFGRFVSLVEDRVYRSGISVAGALANVRLAKNKIDRQRESDEKGFNVKLGRGGVREIEFITQALQLAFGGDDPWLRTSHTLVTLGRLAERRFVSEREHSQLSDAYHFLRTLEHRLQMEHGLQTHAVPLDPLRRELVARRMNFSGSGALAEFEASLAAHTGNVHAAFNRVFAGDAATSVTAPRRPTEDPLDERIKKVSETAAKVLALETEGPRPLGAASVNVAVLTEQKLRASANTTRAVSFMNRITAALEKEEAPIAINESQLNGLIQLCDASEYFAEMIANRLSLIRALPITFADNCGRDYENELIKAVAEKSTFADELTALRLSWSRLLIEIGAQEVAGSRDSFQVNRRLTDLAKGTANAALLIAQRELARRYRPLAADPRVAVLALGRFGSGGMDYGSDLDLVIVFEVNSAPLVPTLTPEETYARLTEYFITALSSITRAGALYRVDLRLRPDGQKGPLAISSTSFSEYIQSRAAIWEWLAYVKLRAVAGDLKFGGEVEGAARRRIHELAQNSDAQHLVNEARRVRDRLQKAKAPRRQAGINIKHGPGGMLDVYFATRYLQLRDNVPDDGEDRTTQAMLERLRAAGSIAEPDFQRMRAGYRLLRAVDHELRLIIGRSASLPQRDSAAFADIARRLGYGVSHDLENDLISGMKQIRQAYDCIMITE
jgi:glutamate-ammonia-ligase adenylyltransferase